MFMFKRKKEEEIKKSIIKERMPNGIYYKFYLGP